MNSTQSKFESLTIEGISEPTVLRYFETLNAGDFEATVNLFAQDGTLYAPFESPIVGRDSIAAYLNAEAKGMKLLPQEGIIEPLEDNLTKLEEAGISEATSEMPAVEAPSLKGNVRRLPPDEEVSLTKFHIQGKVQTSLFGVNVAWKFVLNRDREIVSVEVKLLASLQELASLRR